MALLLIELVVSAVLLVGYLLYYEALWRVCRIQLGLPLFANYILVALLVYMVLLTIVGGRGVSGLLTGTVFQKPVATFLLAALHTAIIFVVCPLPFRGYGLERAALLLIPVVLVGVVVPLGGIALLAPTIAVAVVTAVYGWYRRSVRELGLWGGGTVSMLFAALAPTIVGVVASPSTIFYHPLYATTIAIALPAHVIASGAIGLRVEEERHAVPAMLGMATLLAVVEAAAGAVPLIYVFRRAVIHQVALLLSRRTRNTIGGMLYLALLSPGTWL